MSSCDSETRLSPTIGQSGVASEVLGRLVALPGGVLDLVATWQERAAERSNLAALDDRLLRDMGISRAEAEFESSKPFWRL